MPKLVGLSAALDMILSGRNVSQHQAAELHLINAAFPADRFEEGVDQFVSDRLEGRPFRWRPSGWAARLRDRTRLGQALVLRTAHRRIAAGSRHDPAPLAALGAVEQGLRRGREAGLRREREAFADVLFSPASRDLLGRFFQRERAGKGTA